MMKNKAPSESEKNVFLETNKYIEFPSTYLRRMFCVEHGRHDNNNNILAKAATTKRAKKVMVAKGTKTPFAAYIKATTMMKKKAPSKSEKMRDPHPHHQNLDQRRVQQQQQQQQQQPAATATATATTTTTTR
jgi:hypothetical protein